MSGAMAPAREIATLLPVLSMVRSLSTAAATTLTLGTGSSRSRIRGPIAPACAIANWLRPLISLVPLTRFHSARAASSRTSGSASCNKSTSGMSAPACTMATWFSALSTARFRSVRAARCRASAAPDRSCSICAWTAKLSRPDGALVAARRRRSSSARLAVASRTLAPPATRSNGAGFDASPTLWSAATAAVTVGAIVKSTASPSTVAVVVRPPKRTKDCTTATPTTMATSASATKSRQQPRPCFLRLPFCVVPGSTGVVPVDAVAVRCAQGSAALRASGRTASSLKGAACETRFCRRVPSSARATLSGPPLLDDAADGEAAGPLNGGAAATASAVAAPLELAAALVSEALAPLCGAAERPPAKAAVPASAPASAVASGAGFELPVALKPEALVPECEAAERLATTNAASDSRNKRRSVLFAWRKRLISSRAVECIVCFSKRSLCKICAASSNERPARCARFNSGRCAK
mmetsp:Transcript_108798/g.306599  ORF Transcript_108798/g.306599 Transcript_108798/m.306599 type:complete len:469 (-) Transcript_108798:471-1877(-)